MGTVTVTLAEDSTTPQNAEAEASIAYTAPVPVVVGESNLTGSGFKLGVQRNLA